MTKRRIELAIVAGLLAMVLAALSAGQAQAQESGCTKTAEELSETDPDQARWDYVAACGRPEAPGGKVWAEDHTLVSTSFYDKTDTKPVEYGKKGGGKAAEFGWLITGKEDDGQSCIAWARTKKTAEKIAKDGRAMGWDKVTVKKAESEQEKATSKDGCSKAG